MACSIHLKKMEAISFKEEWEFWMRTTWNAHIQSPDYISNICSKHDTERQEKVRLCMLIPTPPHPTPSHPNLWSISNMRRLASFIQGFLSSPCSRGSCLGLQAPQAWLKVMIRGETFLAQFWLGLGKTQKYKKSYCDSGNTITVPLTAGISEA